MIEPLPKPYAWLAAETGPRILIEARAQHGIIEYAGIENNPVILGWAREVGGNVADIYNQDSIPWCGLFIAVCAKRAKQTLPDKPLWALSWAKWGDPVDEPKLGDVLVFKRDGGGHVGLYVGEDDECFHVLGGNQSDEVCITRIRRERLFAARRTPWKVMQPLNIRRVKLKTGGAVSKNEK